MILFLFAAMQLKIGKITPRVFNKILFCIQVCWNEVLAVFGRPRCKKQVLGITPNIFCNLNCFDFNVKFCAFADWVCAVSSLSLLWLLSSANGLTSGQEKQ